LWIRLDGSVTVSLPQIFATASTWKALAPINMEFAGIEGIKAGIPNLDKPEPKRQKRKVEFF